MGTRGNVSIACISPEIFMLSLYELTVCLCSSSQGAQAEGDRKGTSREGAQRKGRKA